MITPVKTLLTEAKIPLSRIEFYMPDDTDPHQVNALCCSDTVLSPRCDQATVRRVSANIPLLPGNSKCTPSHVYDTGVLYHFGNGQVSVLMENSDGCQKYDIAFSPVFVPEGTTHALLFEGLFKQDSASVIVTILSSSSQAKWQEDLESVLSNLHLVGEE